MKRSSLAARLRSALVLAGVLFMAGCAVVPGIRMDDTPDPAFATEDEEIEDFTPLVREIDADLIRAMRQAEAAREPGDGVTRAELVDEHEYRIQPGDILLVVVWGHPELANPMGQFQDIEQQGRLVRDDGTIFFPYAGVVEVAGQTMEEVRTQLSQQVMPFVTAPQLDVRVVAFRSQKMYVTGEVREPRTIPLTDDPVTVLDAINKAGGFGEYADRRRAILTRDGEQQEFDILELYATGRGDQLMEDRDVLHIPDNRQNKVFMMGETTTQRSVPLHEGRLTLAEAISETEGLNLGTADTRNIFVMRGEPVLDDDGELRGMRPEIFHLDASTGYPLILAEAFELEPRDIVYVSSTGMVRFNRVVQQILPTVQTLWQTDRILRD